MLIIREETPQDKNVIFDINKKAFNNDEEARLVDTLRDDGSIILSAVLELNEKLVAHIAYSDVQLEKAPKSLKAVQLAPLAVLPEYQKMGYGGKLITRSLDVLKERGYVLVFLLGHPEYYPRFGFERSSLHDIRWGHEYPDEAFMVKSLTDSAFEGASGIMTMAAAFNMFL